MNGNNQGIIIPLNSTQKQTLAKLAGIDATAGEIDNAVTLPVGNSKPVSGKYINSDCASITGTAATTGADTLMFFPTWLGKSAQIDSLAIRTSNVSSSDKVVLGIYSESSNGGIGALLATSAEINGTPTGYAFLEAEIANMTLASGKYWLSFLTNGTTARFFGALQANAGFAWATVSMNALGKNGYPTIPYTYSTTLPSDLSSTEMMNVAVVASAPIVLLKVL